MDVREKLVELLAPTSLNFEEATYLADYLVKNGVTVQDGKPLDAFLHTVDAYKGIKAKYLVFKADTGERVGNCFVLCTDKDHAAVEAIRAYASAIDNETLAEDIYNWVGKGEPVQDWISVDDRLPESFESVLVFRDGKITIDHHEENGWFAYDFNGKRATHWMPIPKPPKGE